ncbi:hypothetical protein GCM10023313_22730 [Mucilaginibacter defluvii]|uniref:Secreted protein n=1 Tax=Mucilaginibacter defluvii TaxID=1196019 RepID=A0ABP9FV02_9SPHI
MSGLIFIGFYCCLRNYILAESAFVVSVVAAAVSVVAAESVATAAESVAAVSEPTVLDELLQAETAIEIAKAKKPNLNAFFMIVFLFV